MVKPTIFEEASGLPLLSFNEANERVVTLTRVLKNLVCQIDKSNLFVAQITDDLSHKFMRNVAYLEAVRTLEEGYE